MEIKTKSNLISLKDKEAKYDLREWGPAHQKKGKGANLNADELKKLRDVLGGIEL